MSDNLLKLGEVDLRIIARALRSGRLSHPYTTAGLQRLVPSAVAVNVATDLQRYSEQGFNNLQLVTFIDAITDDRVLRASPESVIDLVTTGPEAGGVANRDTRVVVHELFAGAEQSVLVAGYAVYQGQRVFQALAERMQAQPELKVRMFLDVKRNLGDTTEQGELLKRFADRFRRFDWPQDYRLPEVFFYPRSLEESPELRASLHAK